MTFTKTKRWFNIKDKEKAFSLAEAFKIKVTVLIHKVTLETSSSAHTEGPVADFDLSWEGSVL